MNSNTFCILPFKSIYVKPSGKVGPCCVSKSFDSKVNYNTDSIENVFNSQEYKELRKQLLNGERPNICSYCWEKESNGINSFRQHWNENLGIDFEINEDYSVNPKLEYIDVRLSNLCNFKCIMCVHEYSSNHYTEREEKLGLPRVLKIRESFSDELKPLLKNLKYVYFAGGEPLITKEHFELLSYLHTHNRDIHLSYNTNLSTIKYDVHNLVDMWKDFKSVLVSISLDGLYEKGEFIRFGMNTQKVIDNILMLKKNNIKYNISYTVGNYNVEDIFDFLSQIKRLNLIESEEQVSFNNLVLVPHRLSLKNMSQDKKNEITDKLNKGLTEVESDKIKKDILDIMSFMNNKRKFI